jgi:nucleoside-diphosphate-sugar epimerase
VHLACVVLRERTPVREMRRVNVDDSLALIAAARGQVIVASSVSVYGRGEALTEAAPFAPLSGFLYAEHKAALDRAIRDARPDAAILRPHMIFGPHAQPLLKRLARLPVHPRVPDPQPRLQAVHEDDVSAAIIAALHARAQGPFNLAHPRTFSWRELVRAHAPRSRPVPLAALAPALRLAWRLTGWGGEPGWLEGATHSLTMDCTRARIELGWTAARDPFDAA